MENSHTLVRRISRASRKTSTSGTASPRTSSPSSRRSRGCTLYSRPTVLAWRDKPVTPAQIGEQLKAAYVLHRSVRRSGTGWLRPARGRADASRSGGASTTARWRTSSRCRTRSPARSPRRSASELTPQEQEALAAKPTETSRPTTSTCAARATRAACTRRISSSRCRCLRRGFPAIRISRSGTPRSPTSAPTLPPLRSRPVLDRPRPSAAFERRPAALRPDLPEVMVAQAWILYSRGEYADAARIVRLEGDPPQTRLRGRLLPPASLPSTPPVSTRRS